MNNGVNKYSISLPWRCRGVRGRGAAGPGGPGRRSGPLGVRERGPGKTGALSLGGYTLYPILAWRANPGVPEKCRGASFKGTPYLRNKIWQI